MRGASSFIVIAMLAAMPTLAVAVLSDGAGGAREAGLCGSDPNPGMRMAAPLRLPDQRLVEARAAGAGTEDGGIVSVLAELGLVRAERGPRRPVGLVLRI